MSLTHSELTRPIIDAAITVHRALGPGLLESAYQACLAEEFQRKGIQFEREVPIALKYGSAELDCGYRLDFVVTRSIVVELKAVDAIHPIHHAQMMTYLKLTRLRIGLILNFNVQYLRDGIKRVVM